MTFTHEHPFDPSYGLDEKALRAITTPPEPADFAAFWQETHRLAAAVPLALELAEIASPYPRHRVDIVRFTGLGGDRHGAWLLRPRDGAPARGLVVGHGYGGREAPDAVPREVAAIFPCAPGFHLSARFGLPNEAARHVIHGIATREGYIIRNCVAGLWAAASALLALCPSVAGRLAYAGGSFGGGLGALALPWDRRFARAWLDVPTFGHHPWRLRCPCVGSGEAVRLWHQAHPEVVTVLAYYDAAVAATKLRIPTMISPALFDPAVPPPGQFAVANAVPGGIIRAKTAGHFDWPGEIAEQQRLSGETTAFLAMK